MKSTYHRRITVAVISVTLAAFGSILNGDERRAKKPTFDDPRWKEAFFESLDQALPGKRPNLADVRKAAAKRSETNPEKKVAKKSTTEGGWKRLVSSDSLEAEIKRVRLRYDGLITTPGAFNSGGFQDARLNLSVLATLFGVVHEYGDTVRWKKDAEAARDLLARTANNCKAGSTQVYNEAKLRKADLQDLISGSGVTASPNKKKTEDWSSIADRAPLMEYAEELIGRIEDNAVDEDTVKNQSEPLVQDVELLAMLGEVLVQEGMDDAGDDQYDEYSRAMSKDCLDILAALQTEDHSRAESGIARLRTRCDDCHGDYR